MGLIKSLNNTDLNEIILMTQPASLQKMTGRNLSNEERDVRRAEYVRNKLSEIRTGLE
jgi:protein arginine kinase